MSGLLAELKRRNVIRMAGLYLVGANGVSVASLRIDPDWDPLRGDPRFEALLKSDSGGSQKP